MIELPELPPCPRHPSGQNYSGFASCRICWQQFYFKFEYQKAVGRINREYKAYMQEIERVLDEIVSDNAR